MLPSSIRNLRPRISQSFMMAMGLIAATACLATRAPGQAAFNDPTIDAAIRAQTVQEISEMLEARYVFPEVAAKCAEHLQSRLDSGAYDQFTTAIPFADALTTDLQSVSRDKHLRVGMRPPQEASLSESEEPTPEQERAMRERMRKSMRMRNFGFQQVEIFDGNIGYLDLRAFAPAELGGETAVHAMAMLSNADAVIVDLRNNGGGSPDMIQLITTYFFDEPTLLNTMYWREGDRTDQFWTLPHVPGRRMADTPLYVLTSNRTFSGAEEFAYNMKNLKRATLIGETTGGGAHPGGDMPVNQLFRMFVPVGRAINPISKTNWEGVGVEPDVQSSAADALTLARVKAIETLAAKAVDPEDKARLTWAKTGLEASLNRISLDAADLGAYEGTYGVRRIWVENDQLQYQREGMPARALVPMAGDLFALDGVAYFRIRFERDGSGEVVRLIGMYDDGRVEPMDRSGD